MSPEVLYSLEYKSRVQSRSDPQPFHQRLVRASPKCLADIFRSVRVVDRGFSSQSANSFARSQFNTDQVGVIQIS